jgi:hypothetical protein
LPSSRDSISSITETPFAAAVTKGEIDASAAYLDTKNKSIGVAGGISGSGGDVTLKGTTGDPSAGQERTSMPLFGISPSMQFGGGGLESFKKGNGSVFGGPTSTSKADSPKRELEFSLSSDLVQAKVPSNKAHHLCYQSRTCSQRI